MSFFSWLRNPMGNRARRARPRAPAPRFRPRLEALEGRCVPTSTTLKVTSLLDSGPGSLRYEIAQAQSNDTIVFDFGNKKANSTPHTITLTSGELDIKKNLTIQGPGAGLLTVTSTGSYDTGSRIFEVDYAGTTASLSGMTISNGNSYSRNPAFGVPSPYDGTGGGVLNFGRLTISGCTLSGNTAFGGPGGAIANFGTLAVSACTLSNNITTGGQGGGIYTAGTLIVSATTLSGNHAFADFPNYGGGIYNDFGATLTVSGCTLTGNTADAGGGIYNAGTLTVSNSSFSSNTPDNIFGPYIDGGGNSFT